MRVTCALLALALTGCLPACEDRPRTMTLDDQELARVTEDTGSVTMSGCVAVCGDFEVWMNHPVADGARPDAAPGVGSPASRCALSGHELTCFWHLCAL